jgi:pimeloyl-ACP methyl ester carboxylesterase
MSTLEVHGLRMGVHRFGEPGSSPAIVCLPSTGLSGLQWRRFAKLMSGRGHAVWTVDLIGYGESDDWPRERAPFRTAYDVDVAEALLEGCGEDPVHLVGHSYGGRVALALGLRAPERVRSLALFEPTCFGVLRSTGDEAAVAELEAHDHDGRFLSDEFGGSPAWVERFVDYWSGPGSFAEFDEHERRAWLRSARKMFEEVRETALDVVPHTAYVEALGQVPLLAMSGAASTLAGRRCSEVLAAVMPKGRHVELADVGHMAPVLAGREVAELIAAHIATVERG